jgi:hypothetical protein
VRRFGFSTTETKIVVMHDDALFRLIQNLGGGGNEPRNPNHPILVLIRIFLFQAVLTMAVINCT